MAVWTAMSVLAASEKAEHSLGLLPTRVAVLLSEEAAAASGSLRVVVEGIRLVHPGAVYQVYLNLPEGQKPDPQGFHYLGHVAAFGKVRADGPVGRRSFDITDQVRTLRERGEWTGEIELTFVRGNPEPSAAGDGKPQEFLRFSHISVIEH